MNRRTFTLSAAILTAVACCMFVGQAANAQSKSKSKSTKRATAKKTSQTKGRLPYFYGQLELTEEQREKVLKVVDKNAAKIAKLEKELRELREKQAADCEKLLTTTQRRALAKLRASDTSKKKTRETSSRKKKTPSKKSTSKKSTKKSPSKKSTKRSTKKKK